MTVEKGLRDGAGPSSATLPQASETLARRSFLGGMLALSGCAAAPQLLPASPTMAAELNQVRFDADSGFETWAQHLVLERITGHAPLTIT